MANQEAAADIPSPIELKDDKKEVQVNPREIPHRSKVVLSKVNDLVNVKLTTSEIGVLKNRYNLITEKVSGEDKLQLADWQKLADLDLPEDSEQKIKCNPGRKSVVLVRDFIGGASAMAGLVALTYATLNDFFHFAIPFPIVFLLVVIGGITSGCLASMAKAYSMQSEEQEDIAKLKVYQEGLEILRTLTSIEHRILREAIQAYENLADEKKTPYLQVNIIPPYIPKNLKMKNHNIEDSEVHFLLREHKELTYKVAKFHIFFPGNEHESPATSVKPSINRLVQIFASIKNTFTIFMSYVGTIGATGGLWGGAMIVKDAYDHEGSWKSPEALFILAILMTFALLMAYWYRKHDTHKAAVNSLLTLMQKEFLKFQETYLDAVEATRYMLALTSNPNALPENPAIKITKE